VIIFGQNLHGLVFIVSNLLGEALLVEIGENVVNCIGLDLAKLLQKLPYLLFDVFVFLPKFLRPLLKLLFDHLPYKGVQIFLE
jgi:hypothetical protein